MWSQNLSSSCPKTLVAPTIQTNADFDISLLYIYLSHGIFLFSLIISFSPKDIMKKKIFYTFASILHRKRS